MTLIPPEVSNPATGALVGQLVRSGVEWLVDRFRGHKDEMKAKADENAQNFLNDLALRISRLESELPQAQHQVIEVALSHPSTGLLIHKAFISASTTDVSAS